MNSLAKLIASVAALIIALSFAWIALTITGIVPYHIARFTMYHGLTALVALKSRTPAALTLKMKLPLGADLRRRKGTAVFPFANCNELNANENPASRANDPRQWSE